MTSFPRRRVVRLALAMFRGLAMYGASQSGVPSPVMGTDGASAPGHPERPAGHVPLTPEEQQLWAQLTRPAG